MKQKLKNMGQTKDQLTKCRTDKWLKKDIKNDKEMTDKKTGTQYDKNDWHNNWQNDFKMID